MSLFLVVLLSMVSGVLLSDVPVSKENRELNTQIQVDVKHEVSASVGKLEEQIRILINEVMRGVNEVKQEVNGVMQKVDKVNEKVDDVKEEVNGVKQEVSEVNQKVSEVMQEVAEADQHVNEVKQDVNEVMQEVSNSTERIEDQLLILTSEVYQQETEIKSFTTRLLRCCPPEKCESGALHEFCDIGRCDCNDTNAECISEKCECKSGHKEVAGMCIKEIPDGYKKIGNSSFLLKDVRKETTWEEARKDCEDDDPWGRSHLVTIDSKLKNDVVLKAILSAGFDYNHVWIGLRQKPKEHWKYEWSTGAEVTAVKGKLYNDGKDGKGFQNWYEEEDMDEDDYDYRDCVFMDEHGKWQEAGCSGDLHTYMCEFKP